MCHLTAIARMYASSSFVGGCLANVHFILGSFSDDGVATNSAQLIVGKLKYVHRTAKDAGGIVVMCEVQQHYSNRDGLRATKVTPHGKGHSLWLIPKEPARSNIQKVIDHHSSEQKTAKFRAHVTLIAGLEPEGGEAEVIAKAESLALKLGPISARVERTACMDLYFKSVFALLERDPALLDAHKVAKEAFGQDPSDGSDFMPHASLLYGDLPMCTREAIRQEAGVDLVDPGITLEFESIQVWSTKGVVAEWKPLATLPIG